MSAWADRLRLRPWPRLRRAAALLLLCGASLQLYFLGRIALMAVVAPASTAFERSEAWRLATREPGPGQPPSAWAWRQQWVPAEAIAETLQRAVIAAEDAGFVEHGGIEWDAIRAAWGRNRRAEEVAAERLARALARAERQARRSGQPFKPPPPEAFSPKLVGGSTISQQLAKNLFLSGERSALRKAQEAVLTLALEAMLPKARLLEIYLNHVEWAEGVFGAEAAAQALHRSRAAELNRLQAARLAVLLPAPKRYQREPRTPGLETKVRQVLAAMDDVELP